MLNPEYMCHPSYPVTCKLKKKYPKESERWEKLLKDAKNDRNKGCFTCSFYNPPANEFADVEFIDKEQNHPIPWDTEAAYVECGSYKNEQTLLRIRCKYWKLFEK